MPRGSSGSRSLSHCAEELKRKRDEEEKKRAKEERRAARAAAAAAAAAGVAAAPAKPKVPATPIGFLFPGQGSQAVGMLKVGAEGARVLKGVSNFTSRCVRKGQGSQ